MNHKNVFIGGIIAFVLNIENLFLQGTCVKNMYIGTTFSLSHFLDEKQYFVATKHLFVLFVFCVINGFVIREKYNIYTFVRIRKRTKWLISQFIFLWKKAILFWGMYALVTWLQCVYACDGNVFVGDVYAFLISIFVFAYMGVMYAAITNGIAFFVQKKIALFVGYAIIVSMAFGSMKFSDFLGQNLLIMYINPITTMSLLDSGNTLLYGAAGCLFTFFCMALMLAYVCKNSEKIFFEG